VFEILFIKNYNSLLRGMAKLSVAIAGFMMTQITIAVD